MPDKQLLRLLGEDKRYIYRAVAWMLTGSLSSIGFTACLCYGLHPVSYTHLDVYKRQVHSCQWLVPSLLQSP